MSSIPYLIQRCTIKGVFQKTQKVSEYLSLDYMGSAEFEFGAIPACLREFNGGLAELVIERFEVRSIGTDRVVYALCLPAQVPIWAEWFKQCANARTEYSGPRLKEHVSLIKVLGGFGRSKFDRDNFWFDIVNCVAICEERAPLEAFKQAVSNSVKYMDEQKKKA